MLTEAELMTTMLEFKGYLGSIEISDDDELLHGRLELIRDIVVYESDDAKSLKVAFQEAVDDFLALSEARKPHTRCAAEGHFQRAPRPRPASPRDTLCQVPGNQPQHRRQRCAAALSRTRRAYGLSEGMIGKVDV